MFCRRASGASIRELSGIDRPGCHAPDRLDHLDGALSYAARGRGCSQHPALVVAWTALVRRRPPSGTQLLALTLTYAGILLVVGGLDPEAWRQNLTGSLLVLLCAATTAAYFLLGERCIPDLGSMGFTIVAMSAAAVAVSLHFVATRPLGAVLAINLPGWLLLASLAVLCMFLPTLMQAEGIRRIGAVRGALSATIGPPAALGLGVLLLGERPGAGQLVGTAMIVVGILLIARRR